MIILGGRMIIHRASLPTGEITNLDLDTHIKTHLEVIDERAKRTEFIWGISVSRL